MVVSLALAGSATIMMSESPVQAGPDQCSFDPSTLDIVADPALFDLDDPLAGASADLFDPPTLALNPDFDFSDPNVVWATSTLIVGGVEYGPSVPLGTEASAPANLPSDYLLLVLMGVGVQFGEAMIPDFIAEFPNTDAWASALLDPQSYPISLEIEYSAEKNDPALRSITINLSVGGSPSKPCSGPYGHLCEYLEERLKADQALPNTH